MVIAGTPTPERECLHVDQSQHPPRCQPPTAQRPQQRGIAEGHAQAAIAGDHLRARIIGVAYRQAEPLPRQGEREIVAPGDRVERADVEGLVAVLADAMRATIGALPAGIRFDRDQVAVALTEGVVHLVQDGDGLVLVVAAEPDRERVEDTAEHAREAEQLHPRRRDAEALLHQAVDPGPQWTAVAGAVVGIGEAGQVEAIVREQPQPPIDLQQLVQVEAEAGENRKRPPARFVAWDGSEIPW